MDSVACAHHFVKKMNKFMNLLKEERFFGNFSVEDTYSRTEFLMRGSPDEHKFLWLKMHHCMKLVMPHL